MNYLRYLKCNYVVNIYTHWHDYIYKLSTNFYYITYNLKNKIFDNYDSTFI